MSAISPSGHRRFPTLWMASMRWCLWLAFGAMPPAQIDHSPALLTVAGLLVGIGTRFGSGCTSGHGVCGISRLSPRSLAATASFMAAGFLTVFVMRHVIGA